MKVLAIILLGYVLKITADSLDEGPLVTEINNQSVEEVSDRDKRTLGIDKNIKKDFELKTKLGTVLKISKSITYNDGGGITLLPALLDSLATNKNRVISQLQAKSMHGHKSKHNTQRSKLEPEPEPEPESESESKSKSESESESEPESGDQVVSRSFNDTDPVDQKEETQKKAHPHRHHRHHRHHQRNESKVDPENEETEDEVVVSNTLNDSKPIKYELIPIHLVQTKVHGESKESKTDGQNEELAEEVVSSPFNETESVKYELVPVHILQRKDHRHEPNESKVESEGKSEKKPGEDELVSRPLNDSKLIEYKLVPVQIVQPLQLKGQRDGHLSQHKKLLKLKKTLLMKKISNIIRKLTSNTEIGPPCCPTGPCCPGNQG